jgi:hypothetical protein
MPASRGQPCALCYVNPRMSGQPYCRDCHEFKRLQWEPGRANEKHLELLRAAYGSRGYPVKRVKFAAHRSPLCQST